MDSDYISFVAKCRSSFKFFAESEAICQDYYPEPIKIKPFQLEWVDAIEEYDKVALQAFTGSGKSTIMGVLYPLWLLFKDPKNEILFVANKKEQSKKLLEEVKYHIENSEILEGLKPDNIDETWKKEEAKISGGGRIYCRAYSDSVKSLHVNYCLNDEAAEFKDHSIFRRYVRTRVERKNGKLALISTPVHENDLMQKLSKGKREDNSMISKKGYWNKVYPIVDENDNPVYPEAFDRKKIEELRESDPLAFQKEYLCQALAVEGDFFDPNDIIECYDPSKGFNQKAKDGRRYYLGADFAVSKKGDYSVFTIIESDPEEGLILKHMERIRGLPLPEQEQRIKELHKIFNFDNIVLDETNIGQRIFQNLRQDGLPVQGQSFERKARNNLLVSLKSTIERGKLIIPRNEDSDITINLTDTLYNELLGFGVTQTQGGFISYHSTARHDDSVFALSMALREARRQKPTLAKIY